MKKCKILKGLKGSRRAPGVTPEKNLFYSQSCSPKSHLCPSISRLTIFHFICTDFAHEISASFTKCLFFYVYFFHKICASSTKCWPQSQNKSLNKNLLPVFSPSCGHNPLLWKDYATKLFISCFFFLFSDVRHSCQVPEIGIQRIYNGGSVRLQHQTSSPVSVNGSPFILMELLTWFICYAMRPIELAVAVSSPVMLL